MHIQQIKQDLETKDHPVARAIHKGENFKVIALGFNSGMVLKEHKAHLPTKLTVLEGEVIYIQDDVRTTLKRYDEHDIPVEKTHAVEAVTDSLCLLTQG
jgi:quercetin dioxygenase-like cupin family protein